MPDTKISADPALTSAALDRALDRIPIVDMSEPDATKNKNITPDELLAIALKNTGSQSLTGAVEIIGSSTNTFQLTFDGLGVTPVDGAGIWLRNTTPAAAGAQQISPSIILEGRGWKTNATAASQAVDWKIDVLPIQGAANPASALRFAQSINGGAYATYLTLDPATGHVMTSAQIMNFNTTVASVVANFNAAGSGIGAIALWNSSVQRNRLLFSATGTYFETAGIGLGVASSLSIGLHVAQNLATSGSPSLFVITGNAHTTLAAGTEFNDVNWNLSATAQFATGAITTLRTIRIQPRTYSAVGASVITNAITLALGAPIAGTNVTITNRLALYVETGSVLVGGTTLTASSILDLQSTTLAFTPPRMTTTQKNAIVSPSSGMVVYDSTLGKLCVYGAAAWETITSV